MNAFDVLMDTDNVHRYEHPPKKRWCKRARTRPPPQPQAQRSLMVHIRPPTWMAQPLELDVDVVTVIVEMLMRSDDWRKARYIKDFALVNRTCAAAVASTLNRVRARLRYNSREYAIAQRAKILRLRRNGRLVKSIEVLAEEAARLGAIHETYMEEVGIPQHRRMSLAPFADRTMFHDNVSLLGHLGNACELCNGPMHVQTRDSGYSFRDGPIMLIACGRCKRNGCVELTLSYADATGHVLKAHIEQLETPANNYARALLSKQAAHLKRMRSKRPTRVMPAKLGKRVHNVNVTDEMSICYWNSKHSMSQGPWHVEMWHTLPKGMPDNMTFGSLMGVRDSDAVREESREHAKWLHARRAVAAQKRAALSKLLSKYTTERKMVALVVCAGHFDGWVEAINLCTTARAFEVRWMFRWQEYDDLRLPLRWREEMYKLLEMDEAVLAAAAKRVATVAELLCKAFCRTTLPTEYWKYKTTQRAVTLELLRNFPSWFLERGAVQVDVVVDMFNRASVKLETRTTTTGKETLVVTYTLTESDGPWRKVEIVNYWSDYTVKNMAKSINFLTTADRISPALLKELQAHANRPQSSCHEAQAIRNQARAAIYGLPAAWPEWIFR